MSTAYLLSDRAGREIPGASPLKTHSAIFALINRLLRMGVHVARLSENLAVPDGRVFVRGSFLIAEHLDLGERRERADGFLREYLESARERAGFTLGEIELPVTFQGSILTPCKVGIFCGETHRANYIRYWCDLAEALGSAGFALEFIDDHDLRQGNLKGIDLFLMPGGSSVGKTKALQSGAAAAFQNFMQNGGKYIGICAGMYLVTGYNDNALPYQVLKRTKVLNMQDGLPLYTITGQVQVRKTLENHPVFYGVGDEIHITFERGPIYEDTDEVVRLAAFEAIDRGDWLMDEEEGKRLILGSTAIAEDPGRMVLFSVHPETAAFPENVRMLYNAVLYLTGGPDKKHKIEYPFWADLRGEAKQLLATGAASRLAAYIESSQALLNRCLEIENLNFKWYLYDVCEGAKNALYCLREAEAAGGSDLPEWRGRFSACLCAVEETVRAWPALSALAERMFAEQPDSESFASAREAFDLACHRTATGAFCLRINKQLNELLNELNINRDLYR